MSLPNIPTPVMPDWIKLYNSYDPEHYMPGKRVSAEEWNTLFLASVRQGNYNADTLELLIKTYLPDTYLTIEDYNVFATTLRGDFVAFTENAQNILDTNTATTAAFTERVVEAERVAYSLDDTIQEANSFAKRALGVAEESNAIAQDAYDTSAAALGVSESALATAESSDTTSQAALEIAQVAIETANKADEYSAQAVELATSANLKSADAIATANAAKVESASAKVVADTAKEIASTANTTSDAANATAANAESIAQNALERVTEGLGSKVYVNGILATDFNADLKADITYVDAQIAALVGTAPDALNTLEELASALNNNKDIVQVLQDAIATKANITDLDAYIPQGGTLTAPLKVTGGDTGTSGKIIIDETNKGQLTASGAQTLLGFNTTGQLDIGHSSYNLRLRGKEARPKYLNKDMALYEDVTAVANSIPDVSGFLTSSAMLNRNYIVKGNQYLNVNTSGVQIDDNNNMIIPATSGFKISDRVSLTYSSTKQALYISVL